MLTLINAQVCFCSAGQSFRPVRSVRVIIKTSGYWQVEVKPEDREKTAFITSERLYEFSVPFSSCNGPGTFQRLMNILLAGIQWYDCLVYLDDIIVLRIWPKIFNNYVKLI